MAVDFKQKASYTIEDLLEIMRLLRSPGGCPWDAAQTHASIKKDFIEETYEAIEAINKDDKILLQEELGDVLMQVVFHSQIEQEFGNFNFSDVVDGICKKLIERHPHVFGDVSVHNTDEVLTNWDAIKRRSKHQDTFSSAMDAVPKELPALMRCNKVLQKAKKSGYERSEREELLAALESSVQALRSASDAQMQQALGQVLFDAVNLSRVQDVDPEEALTAASDKYIAFFRKIESEALANAIDMKTCDAQTLDKLTRSCGS